jgi:hypothetical protein
MSLILVFTIYMIFYAIILCFIRFICPFMGPLIWTNKILSYLIYLIRNRHISVSSFVYTSGFFFSYFINEVHFWHYKKYGSVGRFTVFGTYVFKSKLYHFLQMSALSIYKNNDLRDWSTLELSKTHIDPLLGHILSSRYVFSCVICFRGIHFILISTAHALFLTVGSFVYKYDQWPHGNYMTGRAGIWEVDDIIKFYIALLDFFPATL